MQGTVVSGTLPVVVGMQGNNDVGVVGVVGVHGTVVELPGAVVVVPVGHGGSVVELVGAGVHGKVVGVSWPMDVDVPVGQGGSDVVGPVVAVPGTVVDVPGVVVVVVVMKVVVVVPGVGPAPQSNDRNSDVRIAVAAGKPAKAVCSDVMSWQTGWRMAGSSAVAVCETATAGCPSRSPAHRASSDNRFRQDLFRGTSPPFVPMLSSRLGGAFGSYPRLGHRKHGVPRVGLPLRPGKGAAAVPFLTFHSHVAPAAGPAGAGVRRPGLSSLGLKLRAYFLKVLMIFPLASEV